MDICLSVLSCFVKFLTEEGHLVSGSGYYSVSVVWNIESHEPERLLLEKKIKTFAVSVLSFGIFLCCLQRVIAMCFCHES